MNRINKIYLVLLFVAILYVSIGAVSAVDSDNVTIDSSESNLSLSTPISDSNILHDDNSTVDTVFVSGNGSDSAGDGTINNPYATIQKGIDNTPDGKTLNISNGTYYINSSLSIDKAITINGNGQVIINGGGQTRILYLGSNSELTMNNIVFTGGYADNGAAVHASNINHQTTFNNCTFINNTATSHGGAFYQRGNDNFNILTANSCTFINNSGGTGGIFYGIGYLGLGLFNCIVYNNTDVPYYTSEGFSTVIGYNYWGVNNPSIYLNKTYVNNLNVSKWYVLDLSSDKDEISEDGTSVFTLKFLNNDGEDVYSGIYIPYIPAEFSSNGGNLSIALANITDHHVSGIFTPSSYGTYTISAKVGSGQVLNKNITVTKIPLYVSSDAEDGEGNGTLANPYSLNDAISKVNTDSYYDTIKFLPGDYTLSNTINVLSNLTIRAYDDEVVISGESNYRIFNVKSGNTLKLFNITLINGNVTDGGAIYLDSNSTLELTSCVVRNNKAVNGGAIYASNSTKVDLKYNQFNNNSADNGLAIYNAGSSIINGDYNWWGQNQGPSRNNIVYGNIVASKWLIVDLNTTKTYLKSDSTDTITIRLLLNDNPSFEEFTPDLKLTFNFENSTDDNYLSMFDNYTLEYVVGGATGDINGSAVIDDETLNFSYKYVPTLDTIYVSVDGSDINGDGSESNPFATIEHGLIYAKSSGSTIYLKKGVYNLNSTNISDVNITITSYNGEVILNRENSYNIFKVDSTGSLYLNGLIFANGNDKTYLNSAIYVDGGYLSVNNSLFTNCSSGSLAGYVYIVDGNGTIKNTNFTNLYVIGGYRSSSIVSRGENSYLELENIIFDNNGLTVNGSSAPSSETSGILNYGGVLIAKNTLFNNSYGRASFVRAGNSRFINSSILNNHDDYPLYVSEGGILYLINSTIAGSNYTAISTDTSNENTIYVNGSNFTGNKGVNGGAINSIGTNLQVYGSIFDFNTAVNGGAIYTVYGTADIIDNKFINNGASSNGGSIYSEGSDVIVTIRNNTFNQGSANIGGVIYSNGITTLSSNIMINPNASTGKYIFNDLRIGNTYIKILDNKTVSARPNVPCSIKAILTDDMGNPISGGSIILTVNGEDFAIAVNEGSVSLNYTFTKPGLYLINGTYNGSRGYDVIESDGAVNVSNNQTGQTIIADNLVKIYKNATKFTGLFLDKNGNPLVNIPASFKISGVTYVRYTDANGFAGLNINLRPGVYPIVVKNSVTGEFRSYNVTVLSPVRSSNLVMYYKNGSRFVVRIVGLDGSYASGVSVKFTVCGKTYSRVTDADGFASLAINLAPKKYTITTTYGDLKVSNSISVLSRLSASNLNMKYRSGSKFVAKLVDNHGKALSGVRVKFTVCGKSYYKITDSKGQARLNINLKRGTYTIVTYYGTMRISNKIKVS
ncbi:beta strand repeat-containing protein [Methanobrevibacter boviskoreani]|uniref:beta strand repeat-containing protein n=1 Tax=Methanobrevibacter boviskoreani TaxID=1348249 RepID=UPI0005930311|nr:hypothetical protein [Methanobrevibacter boviskoreani]